MKHIVFLTFIGTLALALTAGGAPQNKSATRSAKGRSASGAHMASARGGGHTVARPAAMRAPRGMASNHARSHSAARANTVRSSRMEAAHSGRVAVNHERNLARANTMRAGRMEAARGRNTRVTQAANVRAAAGRNLAVNRQRNLTFARNVLANRAGNTRIVNYWRSDRFRGANYAAFYNYDRVWHDSGWWVGNYPNIGYFGPLGGWWFWNAGYWFPAWGYDPYGWYPYDGPIYTGYANVTPDRVVVEVQTALRQDGYYAGSIDGHLGPQTRAALAAFQADHGLAVTSAIDRPTLQALGVT
jgi:putative peptidoglycan binding protein